MKKNKLRKIILFVFILFIVIALIFFIFFNLEKNTNKKVEQKEFSIEFDYKDTCVSKVEKKQVKGNSMDPLIEDGDLIIAYFDYYNCNEIKRGDIVLYNYSGNSNLVIKSIKGVPGDTFSLESVNNGMGGEYNILINDKILTNSVNSPYIISGKNYDMLALYEDNYNNKIPKNTYLLLGENDRGSLDATRFGLISKDGIVAKVLLK